MTSIRSAVSGLAIASLALASMPAVAAEAQEEGARPPHRAYAIASERLSIIDEDTLQSLGTLALPDGKVVYRWSNAEKNRLALIIQHGLFGNQPVTLVVIDLDTDKIVNTVGLGYEAIRFVTSGDGNRGYVILGGKVWRGKPSVVAVDINSGTVVAKTEIKKEPTDFLLNDSGNTLILVRQGLNALNPGQRIAASMELFDADTLELGKKVDLPGPIKAIYLDYPGRVYFLNRGVDHTSKKLRAQGEIYVVDRETLELTATLEVGMAPGQLAWDVERRMFYLLTSPWATQKQAAAQLHLIGADGIVASIDLPRRPLGAQPSLDREHFYVLYKDDVVRVDRNLEKAEKTLSLKDSPVQLFEHPESGHFFALHYDSAYVSIVDGAAGKTVGRVKSGRNSKRLSKLAAAAGAQVAMAGLVVATGPSYTVNGTSYYHVPIVNPVGFGAEKQWTFGNFSETADYFYVYNSWTDDVTVIDTATHEIIKKIPGGEDNLMTLADGRLLCTVSSGVVRLFDIAGGFELRGKYDGLFSDVREMRGKGKLYLSQELGRAVSVVDLETFGDAVKIPKTPGKVIRLTELE